MEGAEGEEQGVEAVEGEEVVVVVKAEIVNPLKDLPFTGM